jgi:benzodiazapine receptor
MWTPEHTIALVVVTLAVLFPLSRQSRRKSREYYETNRANISYTPPGWVFGIAWSIINPLIIAASFLVFQPGSTFTHGWQGIVAWLINILLKAIWSDLFFGDKRIGLALIVAFGIAATAIIFLVFLGLDANSGDLSWIPFGLYIVYPIWASYAVILNFQWWIQQRTPLPLQKSGPTFQWPKAKPTVTFQNRK